MMNGFILQENTSILISRNGKTLYSILHRSLDLTEKNANIVYTVLVNDDYTVNYDLLKPYLPAFPTNIFLITKETLEVFEHTEENLNLVKEIDIVQKAVDQYVTEKNVSNCRR